MAFSLTAKNAVTIALADRVKMRAFCVCGLLACKNAAENALYKICKNFKPKNKNLKYLITDTNGKILKNSYDLNILLQNTNWKKL